jgi:hypothetical protein
LSLASGVLLTCIWAQARSGEASGENDEVKGASVPEKFKTESEWRRREDVAYFDLSGDTGTPAGNLREYCAENVSYIEGKTIKVYQGKSVFPPMKWLTVEPDYLGRSAGRETYGDTDYRIQVLHFTQKKTTQWQEALSVAFDPANGKILIPASTIQTWDAETGTTHHFLIKDLYTDKGAWMFCRDEAMPAEHILYFRDALRCMQWFEEDVSFTSSQSLYAWSPYALELSDHSMQMVPCTNGAKRTFWGGGAWNYTYPASIGSGLMTPYGSGKDGEIVLSSAPYPADYISPSLFDTHNSAWDALYFKTGVGGPYKIGCLPSSSDDTGQAVLGQNIVWSNQALEVDQDAFGRWRPEWIEQALIDIKVSVPHQTQIQTVWTWANATGITGTVNKTETALQCHLAAYLAIPTVIPGTTENAYVFQACSIAPFTLPTEGDKWTTIDCTNLVRTIAAQELTPAKKLFFVLQAGNGIDMTGTLTASHLASMFFQQSVNYGPYDAQYNPVGYRQGNPPDDDGHVGWITSGNMQKSYITYDGLSLRGLKIKLNWDELENETYLPHRNLTRDGQTNCPRLDIA